MTVSINLMARLFITLIICFTSVTVFIVAMMFLYRVTNPLNSESQTQLMKAQEFYEQYQNYAQQENFDPKVAVEIIQQANSAHYLAQQYGAPQDELFVDIEQAVREAELAAANLVQKELKEKVEVPYQKLQNRIHDSFESIEKVSKQISRAKTATKTAPKKK